MMKRREDLHICYDWISVQKSGFASAYLANQSILLRNELIRFLFFFLTGSVSNRFRSNDSCIPKLKYFKDRTVRF